MILCKCSFELSQLEKLSIGQALPLPETDIVTRTGEKNWNWDFGPDRWYSRIASKSVTGTRKPP